MEPGKPVTAEAAAAIWQRAAHLQAEAAQRLEERSRTLGTSAAAERSPEDFTVEEIRAAALEAGIAPEFVALAIAEQTTDTTGPLPGGQQDAATRFLGTAERSVELSRTIDYPIDVVYAALQRVLPAHPWFLTLREVAGDPLHGGSMVFDVPAIAVSTNGSVTGSPLAYHAHAVDVQQVQLMLRVVSDRSCEVLLRAGLQRSVRRNFRFGRWASGVFGLVGGVGTTGFAIGIGVTGAVLVLPFAAGAALLGGGTALGYRKLYRSYLAKFTANLDDVLGSIAVHAKTGGSFQPQPPVAPRAPGL